MQSFINMVDQNSTSSDMAIIVSLLYFIKHHILHYIVSVSS